MSALFLCILLFSFLSNQVEGRCSGRAGKCCVSDKEYSQGEALFTFPDTKGGCRGLVCNGVEFVNTAFHFCKESQKYAVLAKLLKGDNDNKFQKKRQFLYYSSTRPTRTTTGTFMTYPTSTTRLQRLTTGTFLTYPPTTVPQGCYAGGRWYPPGSLISAGRSGNWCYSTLCSSDGQILNADNFNCGGDMKTTIPTRTTIPFEWSTSRKASTKKVHHTHQHGHFHFYTGDSSTRAPVTYPTMTTTTQFFITPMYCFFSEPNGKTHVWRGGTDHETSEGIRCRCEYWGRVNCEKAAIGK